MSMVLTIDSGTDEERDRFVNMLKKSTPLLFHYKIADRGNGSVNPASRILSVEKRKLTKSKK